MSTLCRRFPEDSSISSAFIYATAMHVRNPDAVKKTAKTYLAARKDDLVLWESLGLFMAAHHDDVYSQLPQKVSLHSIHCLVQVYH